MVKFGVRILIRVKVRFRVEFIFRVGDMVKLVLSLALGLE